MYRVACGWLEAGPGAEPPCQSQTEVELADPSSESGATLLRLVSRWRFDWSIALSGREIQSEWSDGGRV